MDLLGPPMDFLESPSITLVLLAPQASPEAPLWQVGHSITFSGWLSVLSLVS